MKFVSARASDMKRSMPRTSARPATGTDGTTASVAASVMKPAPVTPDAPLPVSDGDEQQRHLLRQRQVDVERLRHEERRERQVDVRAVEVERVAGRHDQTDDRFRASQPFELVHERHEPRFGRRGAEHGEELVFDVDEEPDDVEPGEPGNRAEHDDRRRAGR